MKVRGMEGEKSMEARVRRRDDWNVMSLSSCVHRYSSHANQSHPSVMATISPCAKYIATGSEDRSAYIYDLRTSSSPLNKLSGHSSTVTALAYHPLKPTVRKEKRTANGFN